MDAQQTQIPWCDPGTWAEANQSLALALKRKKGRTACLRALAGRMHATTLSLDGLFTQLCAQTCANCRDNCCRRATAWFDFKDLLYLHLSGQPPPPVQTLAQVGQVCRYLTARGCGLPRPLRPFICIWYVCADQKALLERRSRTQALRLARQLDLLKKARRRLEEVFVALLR